MLNWDWIVQDFVSLHVKPTGTEILHPLSGLGPKRIFIFFSLAGTPCQFFAYVLLTDITSCTSSDDN